ncbi:MAG TPA: hypothetical protein VGH29_19630, partial [Candidatus Binataceae bacterium]
MRHVVIGSGRLEGIGPISKAVMLLAAITALMAIVALRVGWTANSKPTISLWQPHDYKTLPVFFERNDGQTDPKVRFLSHGPAYELFLTSHEAVLALRKALYDGQRQPAPGTRQDHRPTRFKTASVWISLAGANSNPAVEG